MADQLTALETSLRAAVLSGLFPNVRQLLNQYVEAVEQCLREPSLTIEETRRLANRTHSTFDWTRAMLMATREGAEAELARLDSIASYSNPEEPARPAGTQA